MENSTPIAPATHSPGGDRIGSIAEAAQAMKAMRAQPKAAATPPAPVETAAPAETPDVASEQAETDIVTSDDVTANTGEEVSETTEEEASPEDAELSDEILEPTEDSEPEVEQKPEIYTVRVDGKDVEVTLDELKSSYSFRKHNQRESQELAAQRKEFEQYAVQTKEKDALYQQLLPIMAQRLEALMPQPPDPSLLQTDPIAHYQLQREYDAKMNEFHLVQMENQRLGQEQQSQQLHQVKAHLDSQRQMLPDLVPEWKNPETFEGDRQKLVKHLRDRGFTDDEINWCGDARLLRELNDARKYRELVSRKSRPDAPVQKAVQLKAAAPPANASGKAKQFNQTMQSLNKTGSIADAARAMSLLRG